MVFVFPQKGLDQQFVGIQVEGDRLVSGLKVCQFLFTVQGLQVYPVAAATHPTHRRFLRTPPCAGLRQQDTLTLMQFRVVSV